MDRMAPPMLRALRPFRHRQYRMLAAALVLSLIGTGTWLVASVFQVRELGGSPVDLSLVAAANAAGLLVAVLFGGAAADLVPQRRILLVVETGKLAVALAVGLLAALGLLELWQLAVAAFLLGIVDGFFYPAYSALLPTILPEEELLAANGVEGALRPLVLQALGPMLAGLVVAAISPAAAFLAVAAAQLVAVGFLLLMRPVPLRRESPANPSGRGPVRGLLADIRDGFRYVVRTPWLLATLLFASVFTLVFMGPFEVVLPFVITENAGGGPAEFALVLVAYGVGGAIAALAVGSMRLPRRYLTVMNLSWGLGALPLAVVGLTDQLWLIVAALLVVGVAFEGAMVIWGTLLQRRVPPELLGRVSSLDFFVSTLFMPVSMALAGPLAVLVGYAPLFLVAGLVPVVLALGAILIARMPRDELEHPLDRS